MNLSSHSPCESAPDASENRAVDVSLRLPLLLLFGNAVHWLVIATLISLVLAIKKIAPDFPEILSGVSWFGYGRLAPIARDLFLYGWASQAALAVINTPPFALFPLQDVRFIFHFTQEREESLIDVCCLDYF